MHPQRALRCTLPCPLVQRFPEVPRLTPKQLEALQAVTDLADSPELHLDWGEVAHWSYVLDQPDLRQMWWGSMMGADSSGRWRRPPIALEAPRPPAAAGVWRHPAGRAVTRWRWPNSHLVLCPLCRPAARRRAAHLQLDAAALPHRLCGPSGERHGSNQSVCGAGLSEGASEGGQSRHGGCPHTAATAIQLLGLATGPRLVQEACLTDSMGCVLQNMLLAGL